MTIYKMAAGCAVPILEQTRKDQGCTPTNHSPGSSAKMWISPSKWKGDSRRTTGTSEIPSVATKKCPFSSTCTTWAVTFWMTRSDARRMPSGQDPTLARDELRRHAAARGIGMVEEIEEQ